jgi:hypothetical protein
MILSADYTGNGEGNELRLGGFNRRTCRRCGSLGLGQRRSAELLFVEAGAFGEGGVQAVGVFGEGQFESVVVDGGDEVEGEEKGVVIEPAGFGGLGEVDYGVEGKAVHAVEADGKGEAVAIPGEGGLGFGRIVEVKHQGAEIQGVGG